MVKILKWLNQHLLLIVAAILLVAIPLLPKIPFYSPIEEYIVRVRIEDILVLIASLVWLVKLFQKEVRLQSLATWFILAYLLAGLFSVISAIFLLKTVPLIPSHLLKTWLHYFRYLEYFMLYFIFLAVPKTKHEVKLLLKIMAVTLSLVIIYGYGQKYLYWPVYSTMNREFSKGIRLYLTEHARVQSTFAGHYDLAAYLVIILPLVLAWGLQLKKISSKLVMLTLHLAGTWLLIMSASRTSFVAYSLGSVAVLFLSALQQAKWWQKISWFLTRTVTWGVLVMAIILSFGGDLAERLIQVLESYPALHQPYQVALVQVETFSQKLGFQKEKATSQPPANAISTEEAAVLVASDQRPITQKPEVNFQTRPKDVYDDIPDRVKVATQSASGETRTIIVEKPRVWSDNALHYGLSMAIRLDSLWPRAIRGFLRQPFLGSGYATLNKTSLTDFTIADSTDNNFLRTLGETGLLGFLTFYGIVLIALIRASLNLKTKDDLLKILSLGYVGANLGLLFNAFYIDVFAASKVAFIFWALTGLLLGYGKLIKDHEKS